MMQPNRRVIDVVLPAPVGYESAEEAIASAAAASRSILTISGFANCVGSTVQSVHYNDDTVLFVLSGEENLRLRAESTEQAVSVALCQKEASACFPSDSGIVILRSGELCWEWDRDAMARSLVGKGLVNGFHNGSELYIYFEQSLMVAFSRMVRERLGEPLLYWQFSD